MHCFFDDHFDFSECILRGIYGYGLERPMKCQEISLPLLLKGRSLFLAGPSKSGKRLVYSICFSFKKKVKN